MLGEGRGGGEQGGGEQEVSELRLAEAREMRGGLGKQMSLSLKYFKLSTCEHFTLNPKASLLI